MKGKFIAVEGPDGSGKTVQQNLLIAKLELEGWTVDRFDFPQYETSLFGKVIGKALSGEYGALENIHPELISIIYSADRWKVSPQIIESISSGHIAVANRFSLSNKAHQAARLPEEKRADLLLFLEKLEHSEEGFNIPKPDLYFHLDVPIEITRELILKKAEREYLNGKSQDLLEQDVKHQVTAAMMYKLLADTSNDIISIQCCDAEGKLKDPEAIHNEVWKETRTFLDNENLKGKIKKENE